MVVVIQVTVAGLALHGCYLLEEFRRGVARCGIASQENIRKFTCECSGRGLFDLLQVVDLFGLLFQERGLQVDLCGVDLLACGSSAESP